jgi:hypothetical protein
MSHKEGDAALQKLLFDLDLILPINSVAIPLAARAIEVSGEAGKSPLALLRFLPQS